MKILLYSKNLASDVTSNNVSYVIKMDALNGVTINVDLVMLKLEPVLDV